MRALFWAGLAGAVGRCRARPSPLDKVTFGTNWLAEAEHGGYYQAVVDGTYAKYGLDVTILQGGPQANNGLLLAAGKIDFYMGGNMLLGLRRPSSRTCRSSSSPPISRKTRRS